MTKDLETKEFVMIVQFADEGNLRSILSTKFNGIFWRDKTLYLINLMFDLESLHNLGYCHRDFHSGNILQKEDLSYLSDFGLSRPADEQKSDVKYMEYCHILLQKF